MGTCFIGCGEMLNTMGKKCIDVEANGSEQSEDKKMASLLVCQMEVVDTQSSDEAQKSNSNNIHVIDTAAEITILNFCIYQYFVLLYIYIYKKKKIKNALLRSFC